MSSPSALGREREEGEGKEDEDRDLLSSRLDVFFVISGSSQADGVKSG